MDAPLQTPKVSRVPASDDLEPAGDYCFVPKREPIRKFEPVALEVPTGFWRTLLWLFRGRPRAAMKELTEIVWPDYDAIVMLCPHCNRGIGTTKDHKLMSLEPLTIEKPLACAHFALRATGGLPTVMFEGKDGKIMPA
jgi:hypothetical protein